MDLILIWVTFFCDMEHLHRDFRLLHSTCRVELQTPSWEAELYRRLPEETVGNQGEARSVNDGFSRRARD